MVDQQSRKAYYVVHRSWVNAYLVENNLTHPATVSLDTLDISTWRGA